MKRIVCLAAALAATAGLGLAVDNTYLLAPHFAPGQIIAYDGTYRLQVPASKNGKSLILASLAYGLVFKVEEIGRQGAVLDVEYDWLEWQSRAAVPVPPATGRVFRFRLDSRGRVAEVPDPSLAWLGEVWPGWPARPLRVGEAWRVENKTAASGGSLATASREFRLCEVNAKGGRNLAYLDYTERGRAAPFTVNLPDGRGQVEGVITGVGQISLDLASGLVESAATASVLDGTLKPPAGIGGAAPLRLKIETTLRLRQSMGS